MYLIFRDKHVPVLVKGTLNVTFRAEKTVCSPVALGGDNDLRQFVGKQFFIEEIKGCLKFAGQVVYLLCWHGTSRFIL